MAGSRRRFAFAVVAALAATPAFAACDDSAWDAAAVAERLASALPLAADAPMMRTSVAGFQLALAPQADVTFEMPPERPPRNDAPHAAAVRFAAGGAGAYRIALSAAAWIDVVQDGAYVASGDFVGIHDCPGLRKIVTFDIGPGPFTLQLSDAEDPSIAVAVIPAP
jgi:hypothetical protein